MGVGWLCVHCLSVCCLRVDCVGICCTHLLIFFWQVVTCHVGMHGSCKGGGDTGKNLKLYICTGQGCEKEDGGGEESWGVQIWAMLMVKGGRSYHHIVNKVKGIEIRLFGTASHPFNVNSSPAMPMKSVEI